MKWWRWFLLPILVQTLDMRCSNLFGLETDWGNTDCHWVHPSSYYIDELGVRGFNWLRIPFSGEYVRNNNFWVMDQIFQSASKWDMSIILDWHRNINKYQDNWLENISLDEYLYLYKLLLDRYKDNPHLKMVGLFNEYKGLDVGYWKEQMENVVLELEQTFPDRFMWLIGGFNWCSNQSSIDWSHLPFADRVYQDIHKYKFSGTADQDDWKHSFPSNKENTIVGEWGYFSYKQEDVDWAHRFVAWLREEGIRNTCFWVSVSNSGDTGGLWKDCQWFEDDKYNLLKTLWGVRRLLRTSNTT